MQATIPITSVTGSSNTHKTIKAVAEEIKNIGNSAYLSFSLVVMIISLTAWFITFKVNAEASIRQLTNETEGLRIELKELRTSLPSKDWLELKFSSLEEQLIAKKSK